MAQRFNLTAQINLQSPKNVGKVVSDIQRQLKGSGLNTVNIKVKADARSMAQTNKQLQNVSKNSRGASKDINTLNRSLKEATRRFSVITLATGTLLSFVTGIKNSTKAAIEFERELIKISQVTGKSVQQLQGLTKEVTRLSTAFGVSSTDLLNVSRTLAQAGFNAEKTRKALDILAKTTLAATFDNIQDTTEGAIALLRQFGNEARSSGGDIAFLTKSLDAINAVSKRFAVESGDLITVIRRVGGVFSAAGGEVNELIALFTSVRATTRESAETIATGLRTIFTRIQRVETIQQLKDLNIQLQDSQGQFVGAFEAVKRLSQGLAGLNPRDFRFNQIVEQLGGFRQIGKVIPLIQQFATAQQALNVAQNASGSTAKDALTAQQGLAVQIQKVREEFSALIRKFTDSGPFNTISTGALKIASAMIKVAEAVEPLLPLLTTMFGLKLGRALAPGLGTLSGIARSGRGGGAGFSRFATGGMVPGSGNRDTVPAMLTPGEFVIKKSSVKKMGSGTLAQMNQNGYAAGGKVTSGRNNYGIPIAGTGKVKPDDIRKASTSDLRDALKDPKVANNTASKLAIQAKLDEKPKTKGPASKAGPSGKNITGANLSTRFGVSFLHPGGTDGAISTSFRKLRSASNATGRDAFDLALLNSVKAHEKTNKVPKKQLTTTTKQALARYVKPGPGGPRVNATGASVTHLQKSGKKIFDDEIMNGVPQLFERATSKFRGTELQTAAIPLNRLLSTSAIGSIEGQFFEAFVRNITKNVSADNEKDSIFDFTAGRAGPTQARSDLNKLFGPGNFELPNEFKNRAGSEQKASAIGKAFSLGTTGNLKFQYLNKGGGISGSDTVPAMLTPGEFVFNKGASKSIGYDNLKRMNEQGVKGYAAGGVVSTGRSFYGNGPPTNFPPNFGAASGNTIKRMEEENKRRKEVGEALSKNKIQIDKNGNVIQKNTKTQRDATGAVERIKSTFSQLKSKLEGFRAGLQQGAQRLNTISSSAQSFVFLGAIVGSVTAQMSSLDDTTKKAINQTTAFVTGLVGIGATLVQTLTSLVVVESLEAVASEEVTKSKIKEAVAGNSAGSSLGKIAAAGGIAVGGLTIAATALFYFSAKAKAEADKFSGEIDKALEGTSKGGATNATLLKRSAANQAKELKKSSEIWSANSAKTVAGWAAVGAAAGLFFGPIGAGVGAAAGALMGAYQVITNSTGELNAEERKRLTLTQESIIATSRLNEAQFKLAQALADIDAATGLSPEVAVQRRIEAQSNFGRGDQVVAEVNRSRAIIDSLVKQERGKDSNFVGATAGAFKGKKSEDAAKRAFERLEKSAAAIQANLQASSKTLQDAIQVSDPSKTFKQLTTDGGLLSRAYGQQVANVKASSLVEIQAAQDARNRAKTDVEIESTQKELDRTYARLRQRLVDLDQGLENAVSNRNREFLAAEANRNAQIELQKSILKTRNFFNSLSKRDRQLERQSRAIDNFSSMIEGRRVDFAGPAVDELENITGVRDIVRFVSQLKEVSKGGGPQLQNFAARIAASASIFNRAEEQLLGRNLQAEFGEGLDANQILKDLGITEGVLGGGKLGRSIFKNISAILIKEIAGGDLTSKNIENILKPLVESLGVPIEAIKRTVSQGQKDLDNYAKFLDTQQKLRDAETEYRQGIADSLIQGLDASEQIATLSARVTGAEVDTFDFDKQRLRIASSASQRNVDTLGLGLQANNTGQLASVRNKAFAQLKNLEESTNGFTNSTKKQMNEQGRLSNIIKVTSEALKNFPERLKGAQDALFRQYEKNVQAIEKEQQARQRVTSRLENFVVGGPEERMRQVRGEMGARQAISAGTLQMQNAEQRKLTADFLKEMGDLPVFGGLTGDEILKSLVISDAQRMGRISPEQAKILREGTSVEKQLIQANEKLGLSIDNLTLATILASQTNIPLGVEGMAKGGPVYRAKGGSIFKPKGTDTVPAMLSPGEFVIKKSSVDKIGADTLAAINDSGVSPVYASGGFSAVGRGYGGSYMPTEEELNKAEEESKKRGRKEQGFGSPLGAGIGSFFRYFANTGGDTVLNALTSGREFVGGPSLNRNRIGIKGYRSDIAERPLISSEQSAVGSEYVLGGKAHDYSFSPDTRYSESLIGEGRSPTITPSPKPQPKPKPTMPGGRTSPLAGVPNPLNQPRTQEQIERDERLARGQRANETFSALQRAEEAGAPRFGGGLPGSPTATGISSFTGMVLDGSAKMGRIFFGSGEESPVSYRNAEEAYSNPQSLLGTPSDAFKLGAPPAPDAPPPRSGGSNLSLGRSPAASPPKLRGFSPVPEPSPGFGLPKQNTMIADLIGAGRTAVDAAKTGYSNLSNIAGGISAAGSFAKGAVGFGSRLVDAGRQKKFLGSGATTKMGSDDVLASAMTAPFEEPKGQLFTDVTGEYQTRGEIVGVTGSNVLIKKNDGRTVSVPINKLSEESKALGSQWWAENKQQQVNARFREQEKALAEEQAALDAGAYTGRGKFTPYMREAFREHRLYKNTIFPDADALSLFQNIQARGNPIEMRESFGTNLGNDVMYRQFGGGIGYGGGGYGPGNTGQMQAARGNQYMMQQYQQGNQFMNQRRQDGMNFMNNMRNQALSYNLSGPRNQAIGNDFFKAVNPKGNDVVPSSDPKFNRMVRQGQRNALDRYIKSQYGYNGRYQIVNAAAHDEMKDIQKRRKEEAEANALTPAEQTNQLLRMLIQQQRQGGQQQQNRGGGVQPLGQFARGGIVPSYFSSGGMNQDIIPAMLTPGEFVMSAGAVRQHGVGAMKSLNKGQVPGFNRGGMVGGVQYRQEGGILGNMASGAAKMMGLDTSEMGSLFDNFVGSFSKTLDNLTSPLTLLAASMNNLADKFGNFTMTHKVEISGLPDIDANLLGNQLGQSIANSTVEKVQRTLDENNNNFNIA